MTTKSKKTVEKLEKTLNKSSLVDNAEQLELLIERAKKAQKIYATFTQEQVDAIFKAAATAADKARIPLARMAVEETGMGVLEDKIIKNHYASEYIYNKHKNAKTCGVIKEDKTNGIKTVAEPLGVIAGIVPTTNPTSTAIFKSLIALKTRNAIIFHRIRGLKNQQLKLQKLFWKPLSRPVPLKILSAGLMFRQLSYQAS